MTQILGFTKKHSLIILLTFFLVSAVVTSSCGFTYLDTVDVISSTSQGDEESSCNCHIKSEIENLHTTTAFFSSVSPDTAILPQSMEVPFGRHVLLVQLPYFPTDTIAMHSPHRYWPVHLARAHL